jgi:hypothetical protein
VTPDEALRDIRGYAAANRLRYTAHALTRMGARGASRGDVKNALVTATACAAETDTRWCVSGGQDLDGEALTVVVVLDDGVLVVTLYG